MGEISKALKQARSELVAGEAARRAAGRDRSLSREDPSRHGDPLGSDVRPEDSEKPDAEYEESSESSRDLARVIEVGHSLRDSADRERMQTWDRFCEIPRERTKWWPSRAVHVNPSGPVAVHFRHLAVRVRADLAPLRMRSLLVTSALAGEGKTTVATNLALVLASFAPDERIALVDMDLHKPSISKIFGIESRIEVGIDDVMQRSAVLGEARVRTDLDALDVYPARASRPLAHELLGGGRSAEVLRDLADIYDYVVVDSPPVLPVPDTPLLAPHVGGVLAVVRSGVSRNRSTKEMVGLLPQAKILGWFLNDSTQRVSAGVYNYGQSMLGEPSIDPNCQAEESDG